MEEKEIFSYTYSAKQQDEIYKIRKKYELPKEDKMEQLRRLDKKVTQKASSRALTVGSIGTLCMGIGMSLSMTNIGQVLGLEQNVGMMVGIVIGMVGILLISCAYPIFHKTIRKEREKIAPEVIRLTDELLIKRSDR